MSGQELKLIIKKVKKGKVNYFEKIIKAYDKSLYGYIYSLVREKYLAEDLLQETFIKIYKHLDQYDPSKSFSAWIISIARNTVYDYSKKKRIPTLNLLDEKDHPIEALSNNPSQLLEAKEKIEVLDKLLNNLPEKYRDIIILKYFDELKYNEIAEVLDIEITKVKWQLYEARKILLREMNIFEEEEGYLWHVK